MSYTPVGWWDDGVHPLSQANMKKVDAGIRDAHADIATLNTDVGGVQDDLVGVFGVISSGSATANATVAVPNVVGPYVELTVRGSLGGVGFLGIVPNNNTGLGYDWTMDGVTAAGATVQWEGTTDTAWIAGRWSTVLSVATIRIYGQLGNPNGTASLRYESLSGRHSATLSARYATHATGRVASTAAMTSIRIASRDAAWSSYDWQLCGFKP